MLRVLSLEVVVKSIVFVMFGGVMVDFALVHDMLGVSILSLFMLVVASVVVATLIDVVVVDRGAVMFCLVLRRLLQDGLKGHAVGGECIAGSKSLTTKHASSKDSGGEIHHLFNVSTGKFFIIIISTNSYILNPL